MSIFSGIINPKTLTINDRTFQIDSNAYASTCIRTANYNIYIEIDGKFYNDIELFMLCIYGSAPVSRDYVSFSGKTDNTNLVKTLAFIKYWKKNHISSKHLIVVTNGVQKCINDGMQQLNDIIKPRNTNCFVDMFFQLAPEEAWQFPCVIASKYGSSAIHSSSKCANSCSFENIQTCAMVRILVLGYPGSFKIPNFGPECAEVCKELFNDSLKKYEFIWRDTQYTLFDILSNGIGLLK